MSLRGRHGQPRPGAGPATGRRRDKESSWRRWPGASFGDQSGIRLTVVAEGPYVVQFGKRGGHWRGGQFLGVDAPAGPYSRIFMAASRFMDGKIAERWAIRDDLGMLRQLGAL